VSEVVYELKHATKQNELLCVECYPTKRKMEEIVEFLKADKEERETIRKADKNEIKTNQAKMEAGQKELLTKMEADRKADQERMEANRRDLKEMMKMMHANQTKTDAKLKGLSERIEKTQIALQAAEMCRDVTTKGIKEDLTKKSTTKPAKESRKPNASSKPGWTRRDKTDEGRGDRHTGTRHVLSSATDVRRKYNIECIQTTIRGHGGTQSMVGPR
jgi:hypothetical protein